MKIIETGHLSKITHTNGKEFYILKQLSFSIDEKEFISIMGPSGSGKSTFLSILGGLDNDFTGTLNICGHTINGMNKNDLVKFRLKNIGMIFQDFNLIPTMTVENNLMLPAMFARKTKGAKNQIAFLLKEVGLYDRRKDLCSYLSGGEKQRVAIARAFMMNPRLLLADEPTGALDSENAHHVMSILKKVNEKFKTTIVLVTHDQNMADFANRIIHIQDGQLCPGKEL